MACVGGTASAARLKRPKSSAQRGDGLRGRRHPQLGRAGEFAAQTNFLDAEGRMLVARPDFGRSPQDWRPPGAPHRSCSAAMEARLGWLRVCNVRTHALTKGLRPFFNQKRAPPKRPNLNTTTRRKHSTKVNNTANDYNTSSQVKVKSSLESHGNIALEN